MQFYKICGELIMTEANEARGKDAQGDCTQDCNKDCGVQRKEKQWTLLLSDQEKNILR